MSTCSNKLFYLVFLIKQQRKYKKKENAKLNFILFVMKTYLHIYSKKYAATVIEWLLVAWN